MIINDLLKKYDAKFTLDFNGETNEINPIILENAEIIKNDSEGFTLHETDDNGLFELIVKPPNTVIYNYYDIDGELCSSQVYEGINIEIFD